MNNKAVALLSGGLDSTLAICMMKEQGIEIEAVYFQTLFGCCKDEARQVADKLGVPFTLLKAGDDYLKVVEKPKYGYGRGINPCVDCRVYMFVLAKRLMENIGASFLISGEVLEQRPMSQKGNDFRAIEEEAGLQGLIVRPLSAKRLPLSEPEKAGVVDRTKLEGIVGRSRTRLLELAAKYGIKNPPSPSPGCALTQPPFAKKVRDVFEHQPHYERWEFEILNLGRHFRLDEKTKIVAGRNQNQNAYLESLHPEGTALMIPKNFPGPYVLLIGQKTQENFEKAADVIKRYSSYDLPETCQIEIKTEGHTELFETTSKYKEPAIDLMSISKA